MPAVDPCASRRAFLRFLAGSPLFAFAGGAASAHEAPSCATGVCIGRPYLWGLGAFGQAGVERVLELVRAEFEVAMRQCGVRSVKELSPAFVRKA